MAKQIQLRRGTTAENNGFTGAVGEVSVDTDKDVLVVHDGVTVGGFPVAARANANGTISLIKKDGTSAGSVNATGLFNNTLTSTNTDQALTASQGKVLQDNKLQISVANPVNATASRVKATIYTNPRTTEWLTVRVCINILTGQSISGFVDGKLQHNGALSASGAWVEYVLLFVPPLGTYKVEGTASILNWMES